MAGPITRENSAAYRARAMEVKRLKAEQRKRERKLLDSLLIRFASEPPEPRLEPRQKFQRRVLQVVQKRLERLAKSLDNLEDKGADLETLGRAADVLNALLVAERKLAHVDHKPGKSSPVAPEEYNDEPQPVVVSGQT